MFSNLTLTEIISSSLEIIFCYSFAFYHLPKKKIKSYQRCNNSLFTDILPPGTAESSTLLLSVLVEYLGGVWRDRKVTLGQPLLVGRLENRRDKQTNGIRVSPGRIRCRTQQGRKPFKSFPSLSALPGENFFSLSDKTGPLIFCCGTTSTAVCLVELVENWATTLSTETLEQAKITFNERSDLDFFFPLPFSPMIWA